MRIPQIDYSAIQNAYATQFNARQTAINVANQESYKGYMDTAHGIQLGSVITDSIVDLTSKALNIAMEVEKYNTNKDVMDATQAMDNAQTDAMQQLQPYMENGTAWAEGPDGTLQWTPEAEAVVDDAFQSHLNESWNPEVQESYGNSLQEWKNKLMRGALESDLQRTMSATNQLAQDQLAEQIRISSIDGNPDAAHALIDSWGFLNDAQKEALKYSVDQDVRKGFNDNRTLGFAQLGDRKGFSDFIASISDPSERSRLIGLGAAEFAQMESILKQQGSGMMTSLLTQEKAMPDQARLRTEQYFRSLGLSEEFVGYAMDGADEGQKAYAMDGISSDMKRLMNGYMTLDEMKGFSDALSSEGKYGILFTGIEDQVATIRDDFIKPAIESYNTAIEDADKDAIARFEADCKAVLASDAYSIKEKNDYIVTRSMNNPALWAKAKELQDKLMEQVFDPACESLIDRWDPMVESILKKAAGNAWGTERGIKYMSDYVGFRNDLMAWGMAHSDKGFTEQDLDAYIQGTLLPYYLGKAMDAAGGLEELAEDDVPLVTAGVFSDDTSRLGDYVELALDPQMAGTVIPDSSTGGYRFTTGDGPAQLYAEAYTLLSTGLNNMGIVATQIYPFEDADGEAYPFPIARDADGREFALGKKGIVIRPVGDEVTMPTDWLPVSAKDIYTGREDKATEPQDVYGLDGAGQVVRLGTTPGRKASDKELDAELERDWNMRDYPDLSKQPTIKANDEASRLEPASVQENEPAVRIRQMPITDLTRTGRQGSEQFWYQGRWYWVDELDQDGEIFRAYLEEAMKRNG